MTCGAGETGHRGVGPAWGLLPGSSLMRNLWVGLGPALPERPAMYRGAGPAWGVFPGSSLMCNLWVGL